MFPLGDAVEAIGFGVTSADASDVGERRVGTTTLDVLDPTKLGLAPAPALPCSGDSGGGVFDKPGSPGRGGGATGGGRSTSCRKS